MSEEEKKAIEFIKDWEYIELEDDKEYKEFEKDINIVFKLIENQQKEIDEKSTIIMVGAEKVKQLEKEIEKKNCLIDVLQHRIEELLDNKKEINYIKPIDIPVHNYISKDKIREWLDRFELEEDLQDKYDELLGSEAIYKFLKELLKEE